MRGYLAFGAIVCTLFLIAGARGMVLYGLSHHAKTGTYGHGVSHK